MTNVSSPVNGKYRYIDGIITPYFPRKKERFMDAIFKGYIGHNLHEVAAQYKAKTGNEPTVMVVRPGLPIEDDHPAKILSFFGGAGMILATHLVDYKEFKNYEVNREEIRKTNPVQRKDHRTLEDVDRDMQQPVVKKAPRGRPKQGEGICPHCQNEIINFNNLGWWWGWEQGIEPPYWEELRLFVFRRDGFTCQKCNKTFGMSGLNAHHIIPKEDGGPDSARNLTTLCQKDHKVNEPIYSDDQESAQATQETT